MSTTRLPIADAEERVARAFARNGASASNAMSVARALVGAEAVGLKTHGLSRIPIYLAMLKNGKVDGRAAATARRTAPGALMVDAAHGYAYPAIDLALAELPAMTRAQGIAAAGIARSNHCGAAGLHVERLAQAGLLGLMFANTPGAIAPWGGRRPLFGTNPVAFAAPLTDAPPIVVDLSLSKVARGNIMVAKQKGERIPEGWALDPEGRPTTDPAAAIAGTMVPMGDAKGAALALMVEVLAAGLVGANLAFEASSFLDGDGPPPATGQLIVALDPAAFGGDGYVRAMAALAAAIVAEPDARLPGARRVAMRAAAHRDGIEIAPTLLAQIDTM